MPTKKRLFTGIPIPQNTAGEIFRSVDTRNTKLRWVPPWNYHFTTCFMGDQPEERIPEIIERTGNILESHKPFELSFEKLMYFPPTRSRMIWAKFKENRPFADLKSQLSSHLLPGKKMKNTPIPHITLARFKKLKNFEKPKLDNAPAINSIEVNEIFLWQSILTAEGSLYKPLEKFSLK